jgi:restriction system protein
MVVDTEQQHVDRNRSEDLVGEGNGANQSDDARRGEMCDVKDGMIEYNTQNVGTAFEILIKELEEALRGINDSGANALERCDYDMAQRAIEYARRLKLLYEKVSTFKGEWSELQGALRGQAGSVKQKPQAAVVHILQPSSISQVSTPSPPQIQQTAPQPVGRLIAGRIGKGLRTPESAFYCPILQALSDLGGSAKRSEVFLALQQSMRDVLKPIDYQTLSSETQQMRWQNSAQWARNLMVKDGLLRSNSPPGLWEITENGRAFFLQHL